MTGLRTALALALLVFLCACERPHNSLPPPGAAIKISPRSYSEDERRLIFAQIVEDYKPDEFKDCAIIEGAPYKWFLRSVLATNHDDLRKQTNDKISFEGLMQYPGLYRGQVVTLSRGIVLEVNQIEVLPEYGLPQGWSLLGGVFIDSARDVYAFRMLCPPGSNVYQKLRKGIDEDDLPVGRLCGYFMKLYARNTNKADEPSWRRPLLICPEMEFSKLVEPRKVADELVETGADKLLPSHPIDAPKVEERLVVEVSNDKEKAAPYIVKIGNQTAGADPKTFIAGAAKDFCKRLPASQAGNPAGVILMSADAPRAGLDAVAGALRAAGIKRLAVKREAEH
jgi:hypothetical protein